MRNPTNESYARNIMGTSNHTNGCLAKNIPEGLAYSPVFLLGLIMNVAALCAFFARRNSWTDTHIYVFNLVLADSALVIFLPFRIYDAFFCLEKTHFCTLLISIHYINMYASILTTTAISVQRYLSIRFPVQARSCRQKKGTAVAVCVIIWVTVVSVCAAFHKQNLPENLHTCYERSKDKPLGLEFLITLLFVGYLVPLLIVALCSGWIIFTLSKGDGQLQKSTTSIVIANMVVFVGCYMPVHVAFIVNYIFHAPLNLQYKYKAVYSYLSVSEWIAATNCCFDSFSYYFLLKDTFFRRK